MSRTINGRACATAPSYMVMSAYWSLDDHGRDWQGALLSALMMVDE